MWVKGLKWHNQYYLNNLNEMLEFLTYQTPYCLMVCSYRTHNHMSMGPGHSQGWEESEE